VRYNSPEQFWAGQIRVVSGKYVWPVSPVTLEARSCSTYHTCPWTEEGQIETIDYAEWLDRLEHKRRKSENL